MGPGERVVIYVGLDDDERERVITAAEGASKGLRCFQASSIPAVCLAEVPDNAILIVTRQARGDSRLHLLSWQRWSRPDTMVVLLNDGKRHIPLSSVVLGRGMGALIPHDRLSAATMRQLLTGARPKRDIPTVPVMAPIDVQAR